jgi:DNA-binding IclR family transcriptional regulator
MDHGHTVPDDRDPARFTAPTIAVWSAFGRLLFAALPLETAQQWVAQGEAAVETPQAIRFSSQEDTHG